MAYNFSNTFRPNQSNVEPGSLGIKIAGLLMQGANMKQQHELQLNEAKERAMDRVVEQQHQDRLTGLLREFPTHPGPQSYDAAVSGFSQPDAPKSYDSAVLGFGNNSDAQNLYQNQTKWLSDNAYKFATVKGGPQWYNQLQQQADATQQMKLGSEFRSVANKEAQRRLDVARMYGSYNPENDTLYQRDHVALPEILEFYRKNDVPVGTEIPDDAINPNGSVNWWKLNNSIGQMKRENPEAFIRQSTGSSEFERESIRLRQLQDALPGASPEEGIRIQEDISLLQKRLSNLTGSQSSLTPEQRLRYRAEVQKIITMGGPSQQQRLDALDARYGLAPATSAVAPAPVPEPTAPIPIPGVKSGATYRKIPVPLKTVP